jgi:hypothetical protein
MGLTGHIPTAISPSPWGSLGIYQTASFFSWL